MRILVVEGSNIARKFITDMLGKLGYKDFLEAENGFVALHRLSDTDLILTGSKMPYMSGIELVKTVRQISDHSSTPVIMVTDEAVKSDVIEALTSGVNSYLVKPFSPSLLKEKISELVPT